MDLHAQRALSNFATLVDPKVGLIRSVKLVKLSETDPITYLAYTEPCDTTPIAGIAAANRGAACASTADRAILRACGECIERYCSAFFDLDSLRLASEQELEGEGRQYVSVRTLYPFADTQYARTDFPFEKVSSRRQLRWIAGCTTDDDPIWVPASCVFVPYRFDDSVEPFTHMPISTGLAAGPSVQACIEKGICEIVERDALMIIWYAKIPVPRIEVSSCYGISEEIDALLQSVSAREPRTSWFLNVLTLDVSIPIISAALIDEGSPPLTSFGVAAAVDPARALQGALEEALLTRLLVNRCPELRDDEIGAARNLRTLRDHMLVHAGSDLLRSRMNFLTSEGPLVAFHDVDWPNDQTRTVQERCRAAGLMVASVDITTSDVKELGFKVVHSMIPGMQPLDNDHQHRYLGGERLLSVPRKMGFAVASLKDLNPDPHPFP